MLFGLIGMALDADLSMPKHIYGNCQGLCLGLGVGRGGARWLVELLRCAHLRSKHYE